MHLRMPQPGQKLAANRRGGGRGKHEVHPASLSEHDRDCDKEGQMFWGFFVA